MAEGGRVGLDGGRDGGNEEDDVRDGTYGCRLAPCLSCTMTVPSRSGLCELGSVNTRSFRFSLLDPFRLLEAFGVVSSVKPSKIPPLFVMLISLALIIFRCARVWCDLEAWSVLVEVIVAEVDFDIIASCG